MVKFFKSFSLSAVELGLAVVVVIVTLPSSAFCDLFHANNFLIGDRAMGLGGAYSAVSDDASAIVYNPAGMAFAQSPSFSGSANAFYLRNTVYKDTIGTDDFVEKSQGSVPSFFGGIQQIKSLGKGTAIGFAIYSPDSDSKSQNDLIKKPELGIRNFHRTINTQASTTFLGIGGATRLGSQLGVGAGFNAIKIDEITQEYQDATGKANVKGLVLTEAAAKRGTLVTDITQNRKFSLSIIALEPMIGIQYAPLSTFVVGLTYRQPIILSQDFSLNTDSVRLNRFEDYTPLSAADIADGSSEEWLKLRERGAKILKQTPETASDGLPKGVVKLDKPFGGLPAEVRLGLAWFATSRFLWTGDVSLRLAPAAGDLPASATEDVINLHSGAEFYLTPSFPIRFGLFTNFDSRPELSANKTSQEDHIDFYGSSLVVSWASGGAQIGIGTVAQYGTGESQKVADDRTIQEVESYFYSMVVATSFTM